MNKVIFLSIILATVPVTQAADVEAGKAIAATVCAACHGASGVSVSDDIPNLAAQRAKYLEAQLKALKDGSRKHEIMNAIASQLSADDMANVAAYFAEQPGAMMGAKSEFLPNVVKTRVSFPEGYQKSFTKYHSINFPNKKQVRYYYANKAAVIAAKAGKPLPEDSMLFVEVYATKLDANNKPVTGSDGFYETKNLLVYTAMQTSKGWGNDIPEMLRNDDWNYAVFTADKKHKSGVNQAACLACHKPLDDVSYTFTLEQLANAN